MKMKELSALSGISDRTIRYYIDDGLFIPEKYIENYEGRRSYDFTDNDVSRLNQIALLRKYGFSISEIKELEKDDSNLKDIVGTRVSKAKQNSENQLDEIKTLEAVLQGQPQSLDELCEMLSNPVVEQSPIPNIDEQSAYKPMYKNLKKKLKTVITVVSVILVFRLIIIPLGIKFISSTVGGNVDECIVNYMPSEIHSQKEIDEAINVVIKHFDFALFYRDCTLLEIVYAGDEISVSKSHYYGKQDSKKTIVLDCVFETGSTASYDGFENNIEYNYSFVLRKVAGKWHIVNYGLC